MFKRKLAAISAAALMTLSASSAFAAFADLELIRVYYDRNGSEVATDLGKVKDLLAAGTTTIGGSFTGLSANATTFAVYFALDRTAGINDLWATGKTTATSTIVGGSTGLTSLKSGSSSMYALYNTQGGIDYVGSASATSSYKNKLSATQGWLANSINTASRLNTEASLSSVIGSADGTVTQSLYFWDNALTSVAAEKIGVEVAKITTNTDGSTTIVAPTPIPPAFLLMGSGLLGMVGLRRKSKAA